MKKFMLKLFSFAIIIAFAGTIAGCSKEDKSNETPYIKLGSSTLPVAKEGGNANLVIETNSEWSVEIPAEATWIASSPLSGATNNAMITFTLLPNTGLAREADVKIKIASTFANVKIQQSGVVKTYITVAQLRAKGETTIAEDLYVKASLINDQVGGNSTSLKNLYISDLNTGMCVRLTADAATMAIGTELEFKLQGAVLSKYNGLLQLNNFEITNMSLTGKTAVIPAKVITAAQLVTGNFESMYVAVGNVQVVNADLSKTMVVGTAHTSINMEAATSETFVMFNASYSEFKALTVPQGSGTIKGIASLNNTIYQLIPQNRSDFAELTGVRFGNAPQLAIGTATLGGSMKKSVAFTAENMITIPYTMATIGQTYSVSVAVTGTGAAGITTPATASGSFTTAAGNITIPFAGTPTTAGNVTFTISGTGLSTPIVLNGTVIDPVSSKTMATWTFGALPTAFPIASSTISTDDSTNGSLTLTGFASPLPTIGYTATSKTIYLNTWAQGNAWLFSFTPKETIASGKTLSLTFKAYGSSTAPKDFVVEYSKDGTTWTQMGAAIAFTAAILPYTQSIVLAESLSSQVQMRLKVNSTVSIGLGTIAAGGNSRLADVVISVN